MTGTRRKPADAAQARKPAPPAPRARPPRDASPVAVPAETSDLPKATRRRRPPFVL